MPRTPGAGGGRGGDRTHNPELRRLVLYPIELLARACPVLIVAGSRGFGLQKLVEPSLRQDPYCAIRRLPRPTPKPSSALRFENRGRELLCKG